MNSDPLKTEIDPPPERIDELPMPDIATATVSAVLAQLKTDQTLGLSGTDVAARQIKYGFNEVLEKKEHPIFGFLKKFWGLSAWMLELIIIISAVLKKFSDLIIVSILLVVNAVLSFVQEHRAAGVIESLHRRLQVTTRVLRDTNWTVVPARELVPGDIIRIRSGDIVPADIKLISGELRVDQSTLTGESTDIEKVSGEVLSSGSVARHGECTGVVLLTGSKTFFGKTTELVQLARPKLHIEAVVANVVRWLLLIVSLLLVTLIGLSLIRGSALLEMVPLLLVLLMSAVPVALPVMFTVSMAIGSKELARRGVLVTRLSAIEDAATMDVLCVDKTGTITLNQLTITEVIPFGQATEADILRAGALASKESDQDPIDQAFLTAAKTHQVFRTISVFTPLSFSPFDADSRRTEAIVEQSGKRLRVMKGAVETIAAVCGLEATTIKALQALVAGSAQKGYRSLAVARGDELAKPILLGLVTLFDPLRPDAGELIKELEKLGVSVKMLTGGHRNGTIDRSA